MPNTLADTRRSHSCTLLILDPAVDQIHFNRKHTIHSNVELVILDAEQDGILQISDFLLSRRLTKGRGPSLHLHLVALATPGCLYLGNSVLSLDTLTTYANPLMSWGCASISLYADHLMTGDAGEEWLSKLHQLTGATVHAAQSRPHHSPANPWELAVTVARGQVISHTAMPFVWGA